ncbi:MAG: prolipoprotein diacylglyceryl transferase [Oscillospiraceae bacterium]|nr:prolipoprotein diacylglyceryl transferase [Oscillospiraceae bacterium]
MQNATISFPLLGEGFKLDIKSYLEIGSFRIHWYGIIIAIGFVLAVYYAIKRSKQFGLTEDNIIDMLICAVPLAIIGARAYYVIFSWEEYKDNFIDVFKIWQGGLAIYGGIKALS